MWWEYDEGRVDEFWKWRDLKGGELIRFWNIQVGQVFGLISLQNSNSASTPRNNLKPDQVKEKKKKQGSRKASCKPEPPPFKFSTQADHKR